MEKDYREIIFVVDSLFFKQWCPSTENDIFKKRSSDSNGNVSFKSMFKDCSARRESMQNSWSEILLPVLPQYFDTDDELLRADVDACCAVTWI